MFGLLFRTSLLLVIVFAVVYAATRALRRNRHSQEAERIRQDIRKLRAGIEAGLFTQAEYTRLVAKLEADCAREGLDIPSLPARIDGGSGSDADPAASPSDNAGAPPAGDADAERQQKR